MKKAVSLHGELCKKFRIRPSLKFSQRTSNSHFDIEENTIVLSAHPWHGWKATLVHEFAHALDRDIDDKSRYHDEGFYKSLLRVIDKVYSSRSRYDWKNEYAVIIRRAHEDGYTKQLPDDAGSGWRTKTTS